MKADANADERPVTNRRATEVAKPRICPTRTPEVHQLGEFPLSCYRCHVEVDS